MEHKNERTIPCGSQLPENRIERPKSCCRFGVSEFEFPCVDKCFRRDASARGAEFKAVCKHASVWTSLPEGAALKVTHIIDCTACGYSKRISEEVK